MCLRSRLGFAAFVTLKSPLFNELLCLASKSAVMTIGEFTFL
jgi:hypothetical protein